MTVQLIRHMLFKPTFRIPRIVAVTIVCSVISCFVLLGIPRRANTNANLPECDPDAGYVKRSLDTGRSLTFDRSQSDEVSTHYRQQRNELSRFLNDQKKAFGQLSCKLKALKYKKLDVSANGGWCEKKSSPESDEHRTDEGFARAVSHLLKGKHVGSFGDGPGEYKKVFQALNQVASYTSYDGAPFCEKTTGGLVRFLDLSGPQFGLPAFDWVISVEVGEHIPRAFEDVYLDNLVRHAKEGIVLSWAVPGQAGSSHINRRPTQHVVDQLKKRGFHMCPEEGEPIRNASTFKWLRRNIRIYRRTDPSSFEPNDV